MGDLGLFGLVVPEEFGGADADFTSLCVAIEELGRVDQSIGITLSAGVGLGINPILTFGTRTRRSAGCPTSSPAARWPPSASPSPRRGPTRAPRGPGPCCDGDSWVVDGAKAFITNSGTDDHQRGHRDRPHGRAPRRPARDQRDPDPRGHAGLHRRAGLPQARLARLRHARAVVRRAAGCRPATCSASAAAGFSQFLAILDDGRIAIRALAVGLAQACLDACLEYAGSRQAFGRPIGVNQGVVVPDRRPRGRGRGRAPAHLQGRVAARRAGGRPPLRRRGQAGGRDGQAVLDRGGRRRHPPRHAGLRRRRLHRGVPGRAVLPGRQDPRDRRGHQRGPAHGHRPGLGLPVA